MSPANECIPFVEPGHRFTGRATAAITGCRLLTVSAARANGEPIHVAHAAADGPIIGVASHDCASGADVTVISGDAIVPVLASGALTAGQEVECDTNGRVKVFADGIKVGMAVDDAADATLAQIKLYA